MQEYNIVHNTRSDVWVTNGSPVAPYNSGIDHEFKELVANVITSRSQFFEQFMSRKRDIDVECDYPKDPIQVDYYQNLYNRDPIAARVVECMPKECGQTQVSIYEKERRNISTPFERKWDIVSKRLGSALSLYQDESAALIWSYIVRVDIASRIGSYGTLLLGIDDNKPLSEPIEGFEDDRKELINNLLPRPEVRVTEQTVVSPSGASSYTTRILRSSTDANGKIPTGTYRGGKERQLLYIRVLPESLCKVSELEKREYHSRYGQPTQYEVTLLDSTQYGPTFSGSTSTQTRKVHWSRIVHVADNLLSSEVFGDPAIHPVLNRILDLQKLYAGSAEMYWLGAFPGLSFESHPGLGVSAKPNMDTIRDQHEKYQNHLQRFLAVFGMSVKSLAPQVVDPTPQINTHLEAVCIKLEIPKRIFTGSEVGQLASEQDRNNWKDRVRGRIRTHVVPRIEIPLVDRLIAVGVLPYPDGYSAYIPDVYSQTKTEKATQAKMFTDCLATYSGGNCEAVMPMLEYYTTVWEMEEEIAQGIVDAAEARQEEMHEDDITAREEEIDLGLVPDPTAPKQVPIG